MALRRAQDAALARGRSLKVYDCYRPQRAVDDFVAWARRPGEEQAKGEFYPRVPKSELFDRGYLGAPTAHSRGSTVDLTLVDVPTPAQPRSTPTRPLVPCTASRSRLPTAASTCGPASTASTASPRPTCADVDANRAGQRDLLRELMEGAGFVNYDREWVAHTATVSEPYRLGHLLLTYRWPAIGASPKALPQRQPASTSWMWRPSYAQSCAPGRVRGDRDVRAAGRCPRESSVVVEEVLGAAGDVERGHRASSVPYRSSSATASFVGGRPPAVRRRLCARPPGPRGAPGGVGVSPVQGPERLAAAANRAGARQRPLTAP